MEDEIKNLIEYYKKLIAIKHPDISILAIIHNIEEVFRIRKIKWQAET